MVAHKSQDVQKLRSPNKLEVSELELEVLWGGGDIEVFSGGGVKVLRGKVQSPESRVQSPESRVQSSFYDMPKFRDIFHA